MIGGVLRGAFATTTELALRVRLWIKTLDHLPNLDPHHLDGGCRKHRLVVPSILRFQPDHSAPAGFGTYSRGRPVTAGR